jgi:hypothetical protein
VSRTAAFHGLQRVGFSLLLAREGIPLTTTIHISGLNDAACFLTTPGSIPPMGGAHAGSLLTGWLGVDMTSGVKGYVVSQSVDGLFSLLSPDIYLDHWKRRSQ